MYNGLFSILFSFSFSVIHRKIRIRRKLDLKRGRWIVLLGVCRMGYSRPMSASDSICVRSWRIQGVSIVRKRWRYHRRNLRKNSLETHTRYDWGTKILEEKIQKKIRRLAGTKGGDGSPHFRKIEDVFCGSQKIEEKIFRVYMQIGKLLYALS